MRASRSASSAAVCTAAVSSAGLRPGRAASSSSPRRTARGERSSWLASCDERAFGVQRAPQPAEQVVHGPGEGGDLVPGPGDLQDRRVAAAHRDRRCLTAQALDGGEGGTRQPVGPGAGDDGEHGAADGQPAHHLALRAVIGLQRDRGYGYPAWVSRHRGAGDAQTLLFFVAGRGCHRYRELPGLIQLARGEQRNGAGVRAPAGNLVRDVDDLHQVVAGDGGHGGLGRPGNVARGRGRAGP